MKAILKEVAESLITKLSPGIYLAGVVIFMIDLVKGSFATPPPVGKQCLYLLGLAYFTGLLIMATKKLWKESDDV